MFLILVLLRNPVACIRAVALGFITIFEPRPYYEYMVRESAVLLEASGYGLGLRETSFLRGVRAIFLRAFEAAHNVASIELYKGSREFALKGSAGRYVWRKAFGPVKPGPQELYALAAVINKIVGRPALRTLGISRRQEAIESALFFPRYVRALGGLLFDAVRGGVRGNEARVQLTCILVASLIFRGVFSLL